MCIPRKCAAAIGECPASPKENLYMRKLAVGLVWVRKGPVLSYRLNQQLSQSGCTFLRNTPTGDLRESQITIESSKRDSIGIDCVGWLAMHYRVQAQDQFGSAGIWLGLSSDNYISNIFF